MIFINDNALSLKAVNFFMAKLGKFYTYLNDSVQRDQLNEWAFKSKV